jgi:hypothetical protein
MDYWLGLSEGRSRTMVIVLTLSYHFIMMLIAVLDRSVEGLRRIDQAPMIELRQKIQTMPGQ